MTERGQRKYLAIGPGFWAVDEEAEHALIRLLHMMPSIRPEKVHHVDLFEVSEDWQFDGLSVTGSKVDKYPMMKITGRQQDKVKAAYDLIEDIFQDVAIEKERLDEAAQ